MPCLSDAYNKAKKIDKKIHSQSVQENFQIIMLNLF